LVIKAVHVLIVFASTEDHTRKLAAFVAERLTAQGHEVTLRSAHDVRVEADPELFDRAFLMASLHRGRYQAPLVRYARQHASALRRTPTAFISVSLSAAGDDPADHKGLERCVDRFVNETGWAPRAIHHAAGAFAFSRYGWLTRLPMRRIARRRGLQLEPDKDYDLTDYARLAAFAGDFVVADASAAV
jgi:menaquinone-dependent protoporphyrinogen oxidase